MRWCAFIWKSIYSEIKDSNLTYLWVVNVNESKKGHFFLSNYFSNYEIAFWVGKSFNPIQTKCDSTQMKQSLRNANCRKIRQCEFSAEFPFDSPWRHIHVNNNPRTMNKFHWNYYLRWFHFNWNSKLWQIGLSCMEHLGNIIMKLIFLHQNTIYCKCHKLENFRRWIDINYWFRFYFIHSLQHKSLAITSIW